ncbi:hypothetical protein [Mycobacteroides franklinii]|uniref:Uncharacterized protein n=1 Tax=Mycobacteroides franklinii TaxID=948102 RepID=A0A4R8QZE0_9MYCO|nr:hypothetical protein [Mycobacteroides franklinii]TDZ45716.1 hypothetical protein CCUG64054_01366 [Mycobacteroides franklinii]TDZ49206.1 hypothetical protein CCUG63697_03742 [Mycobacteroides franklinii]TDZ59386.1 hypothetical protein CCUG63696_01368 [Mycobacteroides franklinii]TDZ66901.1 hypothetical protein CCUG63695_00731 [Mycobacteroides franklinii]TDZ72825.1 hypothetical protein CCUG64056_01366 [Mycobacteroides franklinii]
MKYIDEGRVVELTERNVTALLAKLDDHLSTRTLMSPAGEVMVRAVENGAAGGNETAAQAVGSEGIVVLSRDELWHLTTPGATLTTAGFTIRSVSDDAHYADRAPGGVYMPESGVDW